LVVSPKKKAILFATSLLLVSTILVGSAVATTNSALQPFLRGEGFAKERSLTRGDYVSLAVMVGTEQDGQLQPIQGATVGLTRANETASIASKQTDERGVAVFELKRGSYDIHVESTKGNATQHVGLGRSMRMGVAFDAEGTPHWQTVDHRELERRGDHKHLMVRVGEAQDGARPQPIEGATVKIYKIEADNSTTFLEEKKTGPRGFVDFNLPRGGYLVKVETLNATGEQRVRLQGDLVVGAIVDGDHIEWRVQRPDSHDFQRPPPRAPPRGPGPGGPGPR
jgi:hypothetical protein